MLESSTLKNPIELADMLVKKEVNLIQQIEKLLPEFIRKQFIITTTKHSRSLNQRKTNTDHHTFIADRTLAASCSSSSCLAGVLP